MTAWFRSGELWLIIALLIISAALFLAIPPDPQWQNPCDTTGEPR